MAQWIYLQSVLRKYSQACLCYCWCQSWIFRSRCQCRVLLLTRIINLRDLSLRILAGRHISAYLVLDYSMKIQRHRYLHLNISTLNYLGGRSLICQACFHCSYFRDASGISSLRAHSLRSVAVGRPTLPSTCAKITYFRRSSAPFDRLASLG